MSDTIKDILDGITFHPSDIDMDNERRDYAEQAINDYILGEIMELIGDSEPVIHTVATLRDINGDTIELWKNQPNMSDDEIYTRNQLRQELRNKANKQFGGSDE
jgi:hypothetical protein